MEEYSFPGRNRLPARFGLHDDNDAGGHNERACSSSTGFVPCKVLSADRCEGGHEVFSSHPLQSGFGVRGGTQGVQDKSNLIALDAAVPSLVRIREFPQSLISKKRTSPGPSWTSGDSSEADEHSHLGPVHRSSRISYSPEGDWKCAFSSPTSTIIPGTSCDSDTSSVADMDSSSPSQYKLGENQGTQMSRIWPQPGNSVMPWFYNSVRTGMPAPRIAEQPTTGPIPSFPHGWLDSRQETSSENSNFCQGSQPCQKSNLASEDAMSNPKTCSIGFGAAQNHRPLGDLSSRLAQVVKNIENSKRTSLENRKRGDVDREVAVSGVVSRKRASPSLGEFRKGHVIPDAFPRRVKAGIEVPDQVLKRRIMALAEAVEANDNIEMRDIVRQLKPFADSKGRAIERLAYFCMDALFSRFSKTGYERFNCPPKVSSQGLNEARNWFLSSAPCTPFGLITAAGPIMEAVKGNKRVHIIEFGDPVLSNHWPRILKMLASQQLSGGAPPQVRITNVVIIRCLPDGKKPERKFKELKVVGQDLKAAALSLGMPFVYEFVEVMEDDLGKLNSIKHSAGEALAVSCNLDMIFFPDVAKNSTNPREIIMEWVRSLQPRLVILNDYDLDTVMPKFSRRFKDCINFHHAVFEAHDTIIQGDRSPMHLFEEYFYRRRITNIVACEGSQRVVRGETLQQWQRRMENFGLQSGPVTGEMLEALQSSIPKFHPGFGCTVDVGAVKLTWKGLNLRFASYWVPK